MGKIAAIGLFALVVIFGGSFVGSYISWANYGNSTEKLIKARYENNQNILAQYGQKVAEVAQVPEMAKNDLKELTTAAISGRYGSDGSKAVFQMIKEQNPTIDGTLYRQIQQVIESGRNDFQTAQTHLIDVRRQYETSLGYVWSGFWLKMAGYPHLNLDTEFKPITTERASQVFSTGIEAPIKLR